jgi:cytochrome c-type biogenesis protein CcmH/NrfG
MTLDSVESKGPLLTPKTSASTWVVAGICIFLAVVIFALSVYVLWPFEEQPAQPVVSVRTLPRSRFTQRSKMSRFASAY